MRPSSIRIPGCKDAASGKESELDLVTQSIIHGQKINAISVLDRRPMFRPQTTWHPNQHDVKNRGVFCHGLQFCCVIHGVGSKDRMEDSYTGKRAA